MNESMKDKVVTIIFVIMIFLISIVNILYRVIAKDDEVSISERRKLKHFPKITFQNILNENFSNDIETYISDQFILRDNIRSIKTFVKLDILKQKDNNGLYLINDKIYKLEYPLNEKSVLNISSKINDIYDKYLKGMNVYYSIIPDKNYFVDEKQGYLKLDYNKLKNIVNSNIYEDIKYIDIFDKLNIDCYYNTDTHWRQECILDVAKKIQEDMGISDLINTNMTIKEYGEFYGTYYGQLGKKVKPDTIKYLTNDIIENSITYNYETKKESKVYDIEKATISMDKYDVFLSGATPLIQIRNNNSKSNRQLIIFRDSFGSSIAPLFTEAYSTITLIDTRYISPELLSNYVDFNNQDVLFIYSTLVINDSSSLK